MKTMCADTTHSLAGGRMQADEAECRLLSASSDRLGSGAGIAVLRLIGGYVADT